MRPRIAITLGDPRGIGPEVVAKVMADPPQPADYVLIGLEELIRDWPGERIPIEGKRETGKGKREVTKRTFPFSPFPPEEAGRVVGASVEQAVALALRGEVQAIVTAPAEKKALHLAGYHYPGHTEWLAHLAGDVPVAMMLASDRLRVVLVTTHLPLRDVARALTADRVVTAGRITARALTEWWGIEHPRLAVCALNPHVG
ncbi:MAG: 4-hydroxythreonine-4-phosphate dehydrogenase PdxA [Gemmatimonadetes bacterium]|nr:4-hydroxythreonine-4-phosphate dehydrogenase PdxA [Gemmatimonadota bacterium]